MNTATLITETPSAVTVDPHRTFATWAEAWAYTAATVTSLSRASQPVYANARWTDRFADYRPRGQEPKFLGINKKAIADCERLAPGGRWIVHGCEPVIGNT